MKTGGEGASRLQTLNTAAMVAGVQTHVLKALAACADLDEEIRDYVAEVASSVLGDADASQAALETRQVLCNSVNSRFLLSINK